MILSPPTNLIYSDQIHIQYILCKNIVQQMSFNLIIMCRKKKENFVSVLSMPVLCDVGPIRGIHPTVADLYASFPKRMGNEDKK